MYWFLNQMSEVAIPKLAYEAAPNTPKADASRNTTTDALDKHIY